MNRKRNVAYIKPEDPEFLKNIKRQAGYDDRNHKFDQLENSEEDFIEDEESEQPQIVVVKKGDLTAEEAEIEKKKIEQMESETKADLTQRVIFKSKHNPSKILQTGSPKLKGHSKTKSNANTTRNLLSFDSENDET